ncbi:PmoA family protein [Candidatus Poribacteria bacterium]|jgi:hypothetical protein|nr:PmoA family protein [Candidatus Poribacteria bacterium]MBT5536547.1 PmoA family protein [Candidatus Poribacteria bacterium]MBT5711732.1 PmoA family protein [Candidatus Poribacteria bacterium]MBT7804764.1 PmoA family protein [Candidatus Poribacteria bacterium]
MRRPTAPSVIRTDARWILHDGHRVVLAYLMNGSGTKPYVSMLAAPSGRNLLADAPADHIHHHGIWWGHGDVNGFTFYLELPAENPGEIRHIDWLSDAPSAGEHGFVQRLAWVAPTGETLITEERSLGVSLTREDGYQVFLDSTYAAETDLTLGTTKESALPIIRMADAFNGKSGGVIVSSEGGRGEGETFGEPARWIDYHAPVPVGYGGPGVEGLACLDHPGNADHPNRWFTRAYGPLSPREGNLFAGEQHVARGETFRFRHSVVVHSGDEGEARIEAAWQEYPK